VTKIVKTNKLLLYFCGELCYSESFSLSPSLSLQGAVAFHTESNNFNLLSVEKCFTVHILGLRLLLISHFLDIDASVFKYESDGYMAVFRLRQTSHSASKALGELTAALPSARPHGPSPANMSAPCPFRDVTCHLFQE
jgi:hypothetical protein